MTERETSACRRVDSGMKEAREREREREREKEFWLCLSAYVYHSQSETELQYRTNILQRRAFNTFVLQSRRVSPLWGHDRYCLEMQANKIREWQFYDRVPLLAQYVSSNLRHS